jgi:hypothetical protein
LWRYWSIEHRKYLLLIIITGACYSYIFVYAYITFFHILTFIVICYILCICVLHCLWYWTLLQLNCMLKEVKLYLEEMSDAKNISFTVIIYIYLWKFFKYLKLILIANFISPVKTSGDQPSTYLLLSNIL